MTPQRTPVERLLLLLAACCVVVAAVLSVRLSLATRTGTVDSYYYYARAASLNDGLPLDETRINWADGVDRKFFPGYPLALHWTGLGSAPERAWRTLALLYVLLNPILLGFAMRRLGLSFGAACAVVAMFATNWVPLQWMTMPMAEGTALFWLCIGACVLPRRGEAFGFTRFLLACLICGMAIQSRAEAAFPAAALGLTGVARLRGRRGWLFVAAGGAALGVTPFLYWAASLPPAVESVSRLHYVNEFLREFSWLDNNQEGKGGFLHNFLRSWRHPVFGWGKTPIVLSNDETPWFGTLWVVLWLGAIVAGLFGAGGKAGVVFSASYLGFVAFRSLWYYPYDRFLVTGLPMGLAAAVLVGETVARRGRLWRVVVGVLFVAWVGRGIDFCVSYHRYFRRSEVSVHSYADPEETRRLEPQLELTFLPLENADIAHLAARRFTRRMKDGNVALELPWPQIAYALRPRRVILGWPLENFWGEAQYTWHEQQVPLDDSGQPARQARRTLDYLRGEGVKYVITFLPRTSSPDEIIDANDKKHGGWCEVRGIEPADQPSVEQTDVIIEREEFIDRPERPRLIRVFRIAK